MTSTTAFIAVNRFGLGAAPGELADAAGDPKAWLRAQISPDPRLPEPLGDLPDAAANLTIFLEARRKGVREIRRQARGELRRRFRREINARALALVRTDKPLVERMTLFWANHFTVSARRFFVAPLAGPYEREAIRPHIFGRFEDMLLAAIRHPAMLLYLDNVRSVGPNSWIGRRSGRGLNENLAREILELHTLGVKGGYSQADVRGLAAMLTGWNVEGIARRGPITGTFRFYAAAHEPGAKKLLGKAYRGDGLNEGEAALRDLARHPATARFLATKLVRHFVADDPPAAAVDRVAAVYTRTNGSLSAVTRALIELPEVWRDPLPKVKTPVEMVVAAVRGLDVKRPPRRGFLGTFHQLGQVPFNAPSPAGWPDTAAAWLSPEALMRRIEWASLIGRLSRGRVDPLELAEQTVGPVLRPSTARTIRNAESRQQGVALLLASAEFQRR